MSSVVLEASLDSMRPLLETFATLRPQSLKRLLPALRILGLAVVAGVGLKITAAMLSSLDELPMRGRLFDPHRPRPGLPVSVAANQRWWIRLSPLEVKIELLRLAVLAWQAVVQDLKLLPADGSARLADRDPVAHEDAHGLAIHGVVGFQFPHAQTINSHPSSGRCAMPSKVLRAPDR